MLFNVTAYVVDSEGKDITVALKKHTDTVKEAASQIAAKVGQVNDPRRITLSPHVHLTHKDWTNRTITPAILDEYQRELAQAFGDRAIAVTL